DFVYFELMPRTSVKPQPAVFRPRFGFAEACHRLVDDIEAHLMRAVRIGKVAGGENLMGLYPLEQFHGSYDVVFEIQVFTVFAAVVEGQVLEVDILVGQSGKAGAGNGLALSDEPFYGEQLCRVDLVGLLAGNKLARIAVEHLEFLRIDTLRLGEVGGELDET